MKIAVIQSTNIGFFPRFFNDLSSVVIKEGGKICAFLPTTRNNTGRLTENQILWGTKFNSFLHFNLYKWTGIQDCFSWYSTFDLIRKLSRYNPDIIHLHVINEKVLNLPMLVNFINKYNIPVVWTMHDCRAFTGRCAFFDEIGCDKWKFGCGDCPQKELYSPTKIENSSWQWKFRNKWLKKIKNLQIITPSQWLASFVKESFLGDYPVKVIYNGINTNTFNEIATENVRSKYKLGESNIILGVAAGWVYRKGLQFFERMNDQKRSNDIIVLVGPMLDVDKSRLESKGIICVGKTTSIDEMKAWYQAANVFVNPTLADNFPTTNIEALASGCPVVTFKTGGSAESIDSNCGIAVEKGDEKALFEAVWKVIDSPNIYKREYSINRSKCFSLSQFNIYVDLYKSLITNTRF